MALHGGISKDIDTIHDIEKLDRMQPCPHSGAMTDLIWSDPNDEKPESDYEPNPRGASFLFGKKPLEDFMNNNGLKLVVRSH